MVTLLVIAGPWSAIAALIALANHRMRKAVKVPNELR